MNIKKWARAYPKLQLMDLAIIEFIGDSNDAGRSICQKDVYEHLFLDRLDCELRLRILFLGRKKKKSRKFHLIEKVVSAHDKRCNHLILTAIGRELYRSIKKSNPNNYWVGTTHGD